MSEQEKAGFKGWAILEIFGHRKLGGLVEVSPPELPGLIRVDVIPPDTDEPIATQYYGPTAIFCLTPCVEDVARQLAKACEVRPVAQWELPAPMPARAIRTEEEEQDEDEEEICPAVGECDVCGRRTTFHAATGKRCGAAPDGCNGTIQEFPF